MLFYVFFKGKDLSVFYAVMFLLGICFRRVVLMVGLCVASVYTTLSNDCANTSNKLYHTCFVHKVFFSC